MNYKISAWIYIGCITVAMMMFAMYYIYSIDWLAMVGIIICIVGGIQLAIFHRCPRCGRGFRYIKFDGYCPHCGTKLD